MAISVQDIPGIMRRYGTAASNPEWNRAAALQDIWLNNPPHTASPLAGERFDFTHVVGPRDSGITLDWTLRDEVCHDGRAKMAFGMLQAAFASNGDDEIAQLKDYIDRLFRNSAANEIELGAVRSPDAGVAPFHAQRTAFSSVQTDPLLTPIDPLLGTLGSFNFYAIPVGRASKKADGKVHVRISAALLYALDSFDFNGEQQLGVFAEPDRISRNLVGGGTLIGNSDYRSWRAANNKGRDFLIVTDVRSVPLALAFEYTPSPSLNGTWRSTDVKGRFALAIRGGEADWTETGPDTGIVYRNHFPVVADASSWRITRPNDDPAVLKMLGFQDPGLQQAILASEPRASTLTLQLQDAGLVARWSGIRVQKAADGSLKKLIQPGDPANPPLEYQFQRV